MNRKISIVIPTFNRAKYLTTAIDSCLNQTVPCEIIVCDHGSTDNTADVVKNYGDRITYIRREKDFGPHYMWLDGILHATNDWIHLNYDDDWIEPTFIEKCEKLITEETAFIATDVIIYNEESNLNTHHICMLNNKPTGLYNSKYFTRILMSNTISPGSCVQRKKEMLNNLFIGNVPFSKAHYFGVGPDVLMSLNSTLDYKKVGYVAEPLAVFRHHSGSITVASRDTNEKLKKISKAYWDSKRIYFMLKIDKKLNLSYFYLMFEKLKHFIRIKILKKQTIFIKNT